MSEQPQLDLTPIINLINQLLPVIIQIMAISLVFSIVIPMLKEAFAGIR